MKLAAFDLEISTIIPEGERDWWKHAPLNISCAAVCSTPFQGRPDPIIQHFEGRPYMSTEQAGNMISHLQALVNAGYKLLTWNGLAFDFRVLAEASDRPGEVVDLALNHHIDLMFIVFAYRGHYLSLQAASAGMGLDGKLKNAALNDGSYINDMSGAKAPLLWQQGEYATVIRYVRQDAFAQYTLGVQVLEKGGIHWMSKRGQFQTLPIKGILPTVQECLRVPEPKTSWTPASTRKDFFAWMGERAPLL